VNDLSLVRLYAVGDIGFIGEVSKNIDRYGPEHPFEKVADLFSRGDIVFGNLEKPFSENPSLYFSHLSPKSIANPKGIESLVRGHFNVVSLANNHILDLGPEGLTYTIRVLEEKGIHHVGAGANLEEARKPVIIEKKGMRIGFFAYAQRSENTAGERKPGAAPLDLSLVINDVTKLRSETDILVVSLHFGLMYTDFPNEQDKTTARAIIDHGADIILGHHPHVIQGMERYREGIIYYSLGEFLFDSTVGNIHCKWVESKRKESLIAEVTLFNRGIAAVSDFPAVLDDLYHPFIAEGQAKKRIQKRFGNLSGSIHTLSPDELKEHLGTSLVRHNLQVLGFHLRRFNFMYLLKKISHLRWKHVAYFAVFLQGKVFSNWAKRDWHGDSNQ
jgi:poly-gamma-glutamate synthesis protein (capsule biosynthesis protein)